MCLLNFQLHSTPSKPYRYLHLIGAPDVLFVGSAFLACFHLLTAPKSGFLVGLFSFFEFDSRITPLQIQLGT